MELEHTEEALQKQSNNLRYHCVQNLFRHLCRNLIIKCMVWPFSEKLTSYHSDTTFMRKILLVVLVSLCLGNN